jgi:ribosomal protein S18 acetylase RimI-like enzyme
LKRDGIGFRDEAPEDREFLYSLYASTRAPEMELVPWDAAQKEAFLRSQFHLQTTHYRQHYPDAAFLIVQDGDTPIGRFYVDRTLDPIHVLDIAIVPQRRGEGVGSALLRDLLSEAAEAKKNVALYVEIFNPAQRLYQRLGFRKVKEEGVYCLLEWAWDESLSPAKPLPSGNSAEPRE